MKKFREKIKNEDGNILILFALTITILIFFVGLAIDFTSIYMKKTELQNYGQLIRQDRFTYSSSIRFSENPALEYYSAVKSTLVSNGFDGDLLVYFEEKEFTDADEFDSKREYRVRTVLSAPCKIHFMVLLGMGDQTVRSVVNGGESYGGESNSVVWHPSDPPSSYNGSYDEARSGFFIAGDLPAEWKNGW